ncbi:MAG: aldo/keto reductase [Endomicrobia bacterium]|nr:aldo/keto reductase [Endomicrobiia bacterium]
MKRREFIVNSLLTIGSAVLLDGCGFGRDKKTKNAGDKVVTRQFKGKDIPLLSMGCMRLPTIDGKIDMAQTEKMIDLAMRRGVNYFDTAYMYHGGESETAIGKILSNYKRESFYLASKSPARMITSRDDVRRIFDDQLRKCQTDYFDFYMAHNLSRLTIDNYYNSDMYEELMKLKEEGRVKHVGFSFHDNAEFVKKIIGEHTWEFCLMQLNYLDWTAMDEKGQYEVLTKAGIPVIAMELLRGGALTRLTGSAKAVLSDNAPNDTQASFGLRWAAGRENVFSVLSGMSALQHMQENVETFTNYRPITKQEEEIAEKISAILQKRGEINCTACNYCQDCPRGIAIPAIFTMYNDYKASGDGEALVKQYERLNFREKADKCIKCGLCSQHCPQLLDIPPLLEMVDNTIKKLKNTAV